MLKINKPLLLTNKTYMLFIIHFNIHLHPRAVDQGARADDQPCLQNFRMIIILLINHKP